MLLAVICGILCLGMTACLLHTYIDARWNWNMHDSSHYFMTCMACAFLGLFNGMFCDVGLHLPPLYAFFGIWLFPLVEIVLLAGFVWLGLFAGKHVREMANPAREAALDREE